MKFSNGVESPFFQTEKGKETGNKFYDVDQTKNIRKVSFCTSNNDALLKMRLIDGNDNNILEIKTAALALMAPNAQSSAQPRSVQWSVSP